MTNKERYKQAFSVLHTSDQFSVEVENMSRLNKKHNMKVAAAALAGCIFLAGGTGTAYAANVGGIQRTVQVWLHGDQTTANMTVSDDGTYTIEYPDENGETREISGGGIAYEADGTERPLTGEELLEEANSPDVTNGETGLKRKISTLRSFYNYYFKHEMIKTNPPALITMPKLHEKAIVRLDTDEVAMLLDYIEHAGDQLSGQKKAYYEKTKTRDLALITLLLGTGIRVSECVGLDVEDLDFKNDAVKVTRKGGNEMFVYFGEEVEKALLDYLEVRETVTPVAGHEHALFYSIQRKRMGVQAVENLVKKYAQHITSTKKITPHKLRSTYGTALYRETGDIYLVADVLGHKDVNTTPKHYASVGDEQRRKAASALRLREEPPQKQ